ncbi:MAG: DHH family phosphoesterase [Candidatus Magasanikbacteria bacterium]
MALDKIEQFNKAIEDKKNILITFKKHFDGDAIGSSLALKLFLEQLGKRVDIVCDSFVLPSQYQFLKHSNKIKDSFDGLNNFVISIDVEKNGLSELSYDIKENKLRIFITPKNGYINKENITTSQSDFKYDLIITVDTTDLSSLGDIFTNHENFFYSKPLINIDHKANNEHFGQINIIELPASSSSEIVFEILQQAKEELINRQVAQSLLTGIIAGTNSFKKNKVRPLTLQVASKLVDLGADRAFIIKNLYQTKSIATFKIWGTILSHLKEDKDLNLVWSTITRDDFVRSGAKKEDLNNIIDELITTAPTAQFVLLLNEDPEEKNKISGILRILPQNHATEMMKKYNADGDENETKFEINGKNLNDVEEEIVAHIKNEINK